MDKFNTHQVTMGIKKSIKQQNSKQKRHIAPKSKEFRSWILRKVIDNGKNNSLNIWILNNPKIWGTHLNRREVVMYADTLLIDKSGWLFEGILCEGLGNSCKNARWLNTLRVPFLVQGCLLEINVETNWPYFCRVNDAGLALDLRPACQNLGAPTPKWMSSPIYTTLTLQLRHWHYNYLQVNFIHLLASIQSEKWNFT